MLPKLLLLIWLCFCLNAVAQDDPPRFDGKAATKSFQEGEQALLKGDYRKAIRLFEKALGEKPTLHAARRNIGVCYELLGDYPKAAEYYEEVLNQDEFFSRSLYFRAGEVHYKLGNYKKALAYFGKFEFLQAKPLYEFNSVEDKEVEEENKFIERLTHSIRLCQMAIDSVRFLRVGEISNLGEAINSKADELFPFLSNDQSLLFYTAKKQNRNDEDLYYSTFEDSTWTSSKLLGSKFNTSVPEGMSTMIRDGRKMYFTACGRESVRGTCDIWEAEVYGTTINSIKALQGNINSDRWESQASVSCDGRMLFFASNREGGLGKTDIWMSRRMADGSWGSPINLGDNINTPQDEEAPFITNDGKTLYFSSLGHSGIGEQDIFMSRVDEQGNWSKPINLGMPINSAYREFGFFLSADGKTGYFASDRPAGFGGMDIYKFELSEELFIEPITFVEGFVRDSLIDAPIKSVVQIAGREPIQTDDTGRFFICIKANDTLSLRVEKKLYHPYQRTFIIPEWDNKNFYTVEILMQPIAQPIFTAKTPFVDTTAAVPSKKNPVKKEYQHTIFFDFDKFMMSPIESGKLEEFLQQLKSRNIQRVEIIGFSDDVGTDIYNLKLSEERAKQIALHLMSNGILVDQIYIEGRGEIKDDKPKNLNRKVEVKALVLE